MQSSSSRTETEAKAVGKLPEPRTSKQESRSFLRRISDYFGEEQSTNRRIRKEIAKLALTGWAPGEMAGAPS